uniref:Uncharacterized protein n=1 Tax=Babesia bovis TaxID=5865 RepID=S6BFX5_BABBO|nr:hypothetical protein [Babesia bovis]
MVVCVLRDFRCEYVSANIDEIRKKHNNQNKFLTEVMFTMFIFRLYSNVCVFR